MTTRRCALCPASAGDALAAGWTTRTLAQPVEYGTVFGADVADMPAGEHHLCPPCSDWLTNHRDRALPAAVLDSIATAVEAADLHPHTARRLRLELVGMVRHLAEAFTREAA